MAASRGPIGLTSCWSSGIIAITGEDVGERRGKWRATPGEPDELVVTSSLTDDLCLRSFNWARWPLGIPAD
jgi:hypothetical protein